MKPDRSSKQPTDGTAELRTVALVLIASALLLYFLRWVMLPFIIAGVTAYVCTQPVNWLAARARLPRAGVAMAIFAIVTTATALVATRVAPPLMLEAAAVVTDFRSTIHHMARTAIGDRSIEIFGHSMNAGEIADAAVAQLDPWLSQGRELATLATWGLSGVFGASLTLVLFLYFLLSGPALARNAMWLVPPSHRSLARRVWSRLDPVLKRYFVGVLVVVGYAALAAYVGLGLFLGIRHAVFLALLTGMLEMIPVLGPGAAAVIAGLVSIHYSEGIGPIIAFALYATALRLSIDQVVGPLVLGSAARLHPTVIIFCFLSGSVLFGITGIIISVPVALAIRSMLAAVYDETQEREESRAGIKSIVKAPR